MRHKMWQWLRSLVMYSNVASYKRIACELPYKLLKGSADLPCTMEHSWQVQQRLYVMCAALLIDGHDVAMWSFNMSAQPKFEQPAAPKRRSEACHKRGELLVLVLVSVAFLDCRFVN